AAARRRRTGSGKTTETMTSVHGTEPLGTIERRRGGSGRDSAILRAPCDTMTLMPPYPLMRLGGIRVVIDPTWIFVVVLVVISLGGSYLPTVAPHLDRLETWGLGLLAAVLLFGSVLLHELSHALLAQRAGIQVPRIRLFLFGGVSEMAA